MNGHNDDWVRDFLARWQSGNETADIDAIAAAPTTLSEQGEVIAQRAQVNVRYGKFLYYLVQQLKPQRILEIGMANGISSAYIAKAQNGYLAEGGRHLICDPFQSSDWQGAGRHLLRRLELDRFVHLVEDFSIRAVPALEGSEARFDFAFIDGNHCLDYTLADVIVCDRMLNVGGYLALDDSMAYGVDLAIPYLDRHRPNLRRVLLDPPAAHWLREKLFKRRRITLYQKIAEDRRGADAI